MKGQTATTAKAGRDAEKSKAKVDGQLIQANAAVKEGVETKIKNNYGYGVHAKTKIGGEVLVGFVGGEDAAAEGEAPRGDGARGRGGRGGRGGKDQVATQGR